MYKVLNISIAIVLLAGSTALADWLPGDDYKMHYPQLPDASGWDVNASNPKVLADDWLCTESGYVTDIHFWGSWEEDRGIPLPVPVTIDVELSIHSDVPADDPDNTLGYSHPGDLLWLYNATVTPIYSGQGDQGWFDPNTGDWSRPDHVWYYQYNVEPIDAANAFYQEAGTIYWLDISVFLPPEELYRWGWKTTQDHWNDDAVYSDLDSPVGWQPLYDPITSETLDLAFVITPEPVTLAVVILGGLAALIRRRR